MSVIQDKRLDADHYILQNEIDLIHDIPFDVKLSFAPFINYWNTHKESKTQYSIFNDQLDYLIKNNSSLMEPMEVDELETHKQEIHLMMMTLFPILPSENALISANVPFSLTSIYATQAYKDVFELLAGSLTQNDMDKMCLMKYAAANMMILEHVYKVNTEVGNPMVFKLTHPETKLDYWYKVQPDSRFIEVVPIKKVKKLAKKDIDHLLNNPYDIKLWKSKLPWDAFRFEGFIVQKLDDISEQEVISGIKADLVNHDAITNDDKLSELQHKLRSLYRIPDLKLGIVALRDENDQSINFGNAIWKSILIENHEDVTNEDFEGSIFKEMMETQEPMIIKDLRKRKNPSNLDLMIIEKGMYNMVTAPLIIDDKLIGALEMVSPNLGELDNIDQHQLKEIVSLFSTASKRSIDELSNSINSIIKEKYTSIHPSVEWRFREAASNYHHQLQIGEKPVLESIEFEEVYPLYGQSDIRGSSIERSKAIQADLIKLLQLARNVLIEAIEVKQYPIYEELLFQTDQIINRINSGLSSGDELSVHDFIVDKVETLFEHLKSTEGKFGEELDKYREAIDPTVGFIYERRKDYEDSVNKITKVISDYIEEEERIAQTKFPHYIEKYKTDGVEYTIYTGKSLMRERLFGPLYLQNLRLWQLLTMCNVVRKSNALVPQLRIPLETTHLIISI